MADRQEPVAMRNKRLFKTVISRSGPMIRSTGMKMTQDALLDAFIVLFDQCNKDTMRTDACTSKFVNKYRTLVTEIKSLRLRLDDFELGSLIGRGNFGEVRVVKEKQTKDIYAMKILKKTKTVASETASLYEEERDIMCLNASPWLTSLQYSFQDSENLYFVMEYHSGGDLLSLLDRHNGVLTPDMTRFYLAEIALAIRALHKMGFVHRDIKPDNILIDRCGHVKLADFGSAARLTSGGIVNQSMPVGTPEYVAPEILLSLNSNLSDNKKKCCYGIECDYWSLGVLAYEMVVGRTPFSNAELKVTYHNIMNLKKVNYPEQMDIPDNLKDLINRLLEDASVRLKHEGLTKHKFFIGINWHNIRNEAPPFIPTVSSDDDTSNFLNFERKKSTPNVQMKDNKRDFSGKDLPFIGFTFSQDSNVISDENEMDCTTQEEKSASLQSIITKMRQENHNLISKICNKELEKTRDVDVMERQLKEMGRMNTIVEADRNRLVRELAKVQAECATLRQTLASEREDRKDTETNALTLVRQSKNKLERDMGCVLKQLNAEIEKLNDELTEAHTVNNELICKYDRANIDLAAANEEILKLKFQEICTKRQIDGVQEECRRHVSELEARIEKISGENRSEISVLQQKLMEEVEAKDKALKKVSELEEMLSVKEVQIQEQIKQYDEKISTLENKLTSQLSEIASLQAKLQSEPDISTLQQKLEAERSECDQLRSRVAQMQAELTNSTNSFIDHESAIAQHEESVSTLEKELRLISEEKIELQMKLQKTKEFEEENRLKLSSLEVVVDRLEEGVIKLETENAKLKQQLGSYAQPITSEAEARYQERVNILEDQIAKLEKQVQQLREGAVLDKEALKNTRTDLWKTEKQLSDAKIDLRIAKREIKTAEDTNSKLNEDIKKLNEKIGELNSKTSEEIASERDKCSGLLLEIGKLKADLSDKEKEVGCLKKELDEFSDLKELHAQLKNEHKDLQHNLESVKNQMLDLERVKEYHEKSKEKIASLEAKLAETKTNNSDLELNITTLKETITTMDGQLDQYENCINVLNKNMEQCVKEKTAVEQEAERLRNDIKVCRQNLNEEKSLKVQAEQRILYLETDLTNAQNDVTTMQDKMAAKNAQIEELQSRIGDLQDKIEMYESKVTSLEAECQWLKQEVATHLTNLCTLRESNYELGIQYEEESQLLSVLKDRVAELESTLSQLEAFTKEREVRDDAIKNQQSKLINFLQAKISENKKKKTITDVLFGARSKDSRGTASTTSSSTKKSFLPRNGKTPESPLKSPGKGKILSQLVWSPGQFQRQVSRRRLHHNMPHRYRNQRAVRAGRCHACNLVAQRGTQMSVCMNCNIQAHPKCLTSIPKTCVLTAESVNNVKPAKSDIVFSKTDLSNGTGGGEKFVHEGWVKIPKMDAMKWDKKYARLDKNSLCLYDDVPVDGQEMLVDEWKFSPMNNQIFVGDVTDSDRRSMPPTAKNDLPYIIKIALVPDQSSWLQDIYYLMALTPSDKVQWITAMNEINVPKKTIQNHDYKCVKICSLEGTKNCHLKSVSYINEKLLLFGADEGILSLKLNAENAEPMKIEGVTSVKQLSIVEQIGRVIMIVNKEDELIETDYRALTTNAEALSCVNPSVTVNAISLGSAVEPCLLFAVSGRMDDTFYLTAATPTRLIILKWSMKDSQFEVSRILETLHPCNCMLYTGHSVIVGCDKFFRISLKDYGVQEFLDPSVASLAFWRIGSFPIQIFEVSENEVLLCYNEFGVFVNRNGEKIQSDLKWKKAPMQFAFSKPFLFIVHKTSVEVIDLSKTEQQPPAQANEDTISTTSTATIHDSIYINFENPYYLGPGKRPGSIMISDTKSTSCELYLIDGRSVYNKYGSLNSLSTIPGDDVKHEVSGDEFSFTSSLLNSLCEAGCSTPRRSDESDACNTYTIQGIDTNKKTVSFQQQIM